MNRKLKAPAPAGRRAAKSQHDGRIMQVAAAAYRLDGETQHPVPDLALRATYRKQLSAACDALTVEERDMLRTYGDRA